MGTPRQSGVGVGGGGGGGKKKKTTTSYTISSPPPLFLVADHSPRSPVGLGLFPPSSLLLLLLVVASAQKMGAASIHIHIHVLGGDGGWFLGPEERNFFKRDYVLGLWTQLDLT
jgi:hypothetical protein